MFDSKQILDFQLPEESIETIESQLFIFHQRDYFGFYVLGEDGNIQRAVVRATAYLGFYEDFSQMIADLDIDVNGSVKFILDFNKLGLIPDAFFEPDNVRNYFKVLTPSRKNVQCTSMAAESQNLQIIFDLNEQIGPISMVASKFPQVEIIPSSKGMIEQRQPYDQYVNFSLRSKGFYHTHKSDNLLIDHDYTPLFYESDFLNGLLNYVQKLDTDKSELVLILDGYADMASVLEDRLVHMDFTVARIQSHELDQLPEEFTFLPMYSFFSSYLNIKCEL